MFSLLILLMAQQGEPTEVPEVVVTATRIEQALRELPRSVNVITDEELRRLQPAVALDALRFEPGIWLEHRTGTTADPVIRGLSGGNILALIDGNTLSTFWGEGGFAGDDMYGKIDPWSIERIEVVRGPGSVLYGSNALGGVINFITRRPPLDYTEAGTAWGGEVRGQYGTNNQQSRVRLDSYGASQNFRWRLGGSILSMDDYSAGGGEKMRPTGGDDRSLDWNSEYKISDEVWARFDVQKMHRDPVYRYYRPTQSNTNDRLGVNAEVHFENGAWLGDDSFLRFYHQDKEDWRIWDDGSKGVARWDTWTADLQSSSQLGEHQVTWGLALHLDRGESPDDEQFTVYSSSGGDPSKAAPDSNWWNAGLFVQDDWQFADDWSLLSAARFDHFRFQSKPDKYYTPAIGDPAADDMNSTENAFTGGVALTRFLGEEWKVYLSWFRGFRQFAPNFGFRQLGYGVLVPSGLLEPVSGDTYEMGVGWEDGRSQGGAVVYYTDFHNFQNIVEGDYNGSDFFDIEGDGVDADDRVYQMSGNGDAFVKGIEFWSEMPLDEIWSGSAPEFNFGLSTMWNFGQDTTNDEPLRHTAPWNARLFVGWDGMQTYPGAWARFDAEVVNRFDRIPSGRLSGDVGYLNDSQDPDSGMLRPYGLPGYSMFHFRAGHRFESGVELTFAAENLLDKKFRSAHSRVDGMGRTFLVGVSIPW